MTWGCNLGTLPTKSGDTGLKMSQVSAVCKALVNAKENQNEIDWTADCIYIYIYYIYIYFFTDGGFLVSFVGLGRTNKIQASSYGFVGK